MRRIVEYIHSDAWVLLSIILSGTQNGARLENIIAAGDFINHAIFTFEEMEGALARLSIGKYICRKGYYFYPSEKTIKMWNEKQKTKSYIHKDMERVAKFIDAKPWEKQAIPQKANEGYSYKGIDRDQFERAVNLYLAKENK